MENERSDPGVAGGCLVAFIGACAGLATWASGAGDGLQGDFEGQNRDLGLLYVELPVMLFGVPAVALGALALTRLSLRGRAGRGVRAMVSTVVVLLTLTVSVWAALAWLEAGSTHFQQEPRI